MIEQWSATSSGLPAPLLTHFADAAYDRLIDHRAEDRSMHSVLVYKVEMETEA
jgi:hypothetical protein